MNGPASFLVLWLAVSYVAADIYETFDSVVVEGQYTAVAVTFQTLESRL